MSHNKKRPKLYISLGNRIDHPCPRCGAPLQMATGFSLRKPRPIMPQAGDFSLCAECRSWNRFVLDARGRLILRACSAADLERLDPREREIVERVAPCLDSTRGKRSN